MSKFAGILAMVLLAYLILVSSACNQKHYKIPVVKSKKRWLPYDSSKDKKKNRTKIVKYKARR